MRWSRDLGSTCKHSEEGIEGGGGGRFAACCGVLRLHRAWGFPWSSGGAAGVSVHSRTWSDPLSTGPSR